MSEKDVIEVIARWLDAVDTATAWPRIEAAQARHHARGGALREACTSIEIVGAIHESAHAVVGHVSALEVKSVILRSDGSGAADYAASMTSITEMIARVCADLAGVAAELVLGAHPWRRQALAQSSDVLLARLNADVCRDLMPVWALSNRFFATVAFCAVMSNWREIERVAGALRSVGRLEGGRIRALCSGGPKGGLSAT